MDIRPSARSMCGDRQLQPSRALALAQPPSAPRRRDRAKSTSGTTGTQGPHAPRLPRDRESGYHSRPIGSHLGNPGRDGPRAIPLMKCPAKKFRACRACDKDKVKWTWTQFCSPGCNLLGSWAGTFCCQRHRGTRFIYCHAGRCPRGHPKSDISPAFPVLTRKSLRFRSGWASSPGSSCRSNSARTGEAALGCCRKRDLAALGL